MEFELECPRSQLDRCSYIEFSNKTMNLYNTCKKTLKDRAAALEARTTWIAIATCISAFVAFIFIILCCMHSRNQDKQRLKEGDILAPNPNTEQLLNKDANQDQS